MPRRLLALTVLLGLVSGCSQIDNSIDAKPENDLRDRVAELRAREFLLPDPREGTPRELPAGAEEFFAGLDGLDAFLDEAGSWDEPLPSWTEAENRPALLARLIPLEPYFDMVSELLASPACAEALAVASVRPLAYRTSILRGVDENFDKYATPHIERARRWIEILCGDAVLQAAGGRNPERAITSLANALDLLRLMDDRSLIGTYVCAQLEIDIVLALRKFALGPTIDPALLRSEIEPRLAVAGDDKRLWTCLRNEVSYRVEVAEVLLRHPGRDDEDHWLTFLDCSKARLVTRTLDVILIQDQLRRSYSLCAALEQFGTSHPLQELLDSVSTVHLLDVYTHTARLALAVNEYRYLNGAFPQYLSDTGESFANGSPLAPCKAERILYESAFNKIRVKSVSRQGRIPGDTDTLLVWMWSDAIMREFTERDRFGNADQYSDR